MNEISKRNPPSSASERERPDRAYKLVSRPKISLHKSDKYGMGTSETIALAKDKSHLLLGVMQKYFGRNAEIILKFLRHFQSNFALTGKNRRNVTFTSNY